MDLRRKITGKILKEVILDHNDYVYMYFIYRPE